MENGIDYKQITIQDCKIQKQENNIYKFTFKHDSDYPIILYKIFNNLTLSINDKYQEVYSTSLESWVKLFKIYDFKNNMKVKLFTNIIINDKSYDAELINSDLDLEDRPILAFKLHKSKCDKSDSSELSLPCGKFKDVQFYIEFNSPILIKFFTPIKQPVYKANMLIQQLEVPNYMQSYSGVAPEKLQQYNGVVSVQTQINLANSNTINNMYNTNNQSYNGVSIAKQSKQQINQEIQRTNFIEELQFSKFLVQDGKVMPATKNV